MNEHFNMSMRKFLKRVGVTSQQEIEKMVEQAGKISGQFRVTATISAPEIGLEHTVEGEIDLG